MPTDLLKKSLVESSNNKGKKKTKNSASVLGGRPKTKELFSGLGASAAMTGRRMGRAFAPVIDFLKTPQDPGTKYWAPNFPGLSKPTYSTSTSPMAQDIFKNALSPVAPLSTEPVNPVGAATPPTSDSVAAAGAGLARPAGMLVNPIEAPRTEVGATLSPLPDVTAPTSPEPGTELPGNNIAYLLARAGQAAMGQFQDSPFALAGGVAAEAAKTKAYNTYVDDLLAGRTPSATVGSILSPEERMGAEQAALQHRVAKADMEAREEELALQKEQNQIARREIKSREDIATKTLESRERITEADREVDRERIEAIYDRMRQQLETKVARPELSPTQEAAIEQAQSILKEYNLSTDIEEGVRLANEVLRANGLETLTYDVEEEDPFSEAYNRAIGK